MLDLQHEGFWGSPTGEEHCEGSYTVTPLLAEFWGCAASAVFVSLGGFSLIKAFSAHNGDEDYRFPALFGGLAFAGMVSFASHATLNYSLERIDEVVFNAVILLLVYLTWDDSILLMFYQIHMLTTTAVTLVYPMLFHVHLVPITLVLFYRIVKLMNAAHMFRLATSGLYLGVLSLTSLALCVICWYFERAYCEPNENPYIPSFHSVCQFFGFLGVFFSMVIVHICHSSGKNYCNFTDGATEFRWLPVPHIAKRSEEQLQQKQK